MTPLDQLRKRASERQVEYRNHVNYAEYCACVTGDLCAFGRRRIESDETLFSPPVKVATAEQLGMFAGGTS